MQNHGAVLFKLKRHQEAETLFKEAYAASVGTFTNKHERTRTIVFNLYELCKLMGKADQAEHWHGQLKEHGWPSE